MLDWISRPELRSMDANEIPQYLQASQDPETCIADLSATRWVGPSTMVALVAFLDKQKGLNRNVHLIRPADASVANYLSRMGLPQLLDALGIEHNFRPVQANKSLDARSLVALSMFSSEHDVSALVELIDYQSLAAPLSQVLCRTLLEIGNNVPEHAQVPHGVMAAQVIGDTLRLAVGDCGVGVLATLRNRGAGSEVEALRMAVAGVSETADVNRGRGLSSVHAALKAHKGTGFLLSGAALLTMGPTHDTAWLYNTSYPGTIFDARLST